MSLNDIYPTMSLVKFPIGTNEISIVIKIYFVV